MSIKIGSLRPLAQNDQDGRTLTVSQQRLLIVDDQTLVRAGLRLILEYGLMRFRIVEASSAEEAIPLLRDNCWDALLLDLSLPKRSGLDLLRDIKALGLTIPTLVLSGYPEEVYGVRVLRAGAAGYLTKNAAPTELAKAVQKVLGGGRYISERLGQCLAQELAGPDGAALHQYLTNRELDVMRMIASGLTVSDIASSMCLSVKTVSTYRARLMTKLHLKSNAALTYYAFAHGVVEPLVRIH